MNCRVKIVNKVFFTKSYLDDDENRISPDVRTVNSGILHYRNYLHRHRNYLHRHRNYLHRHRNYLHHRRHRYQKFKISRYSICQQKK
jgi:hypothetical protein